MDSSKYSMLYTPLKRQEMEDHLTLGKLFWNTCKLRIMGAAKAQL